MTTAGTPTLTLTADRTDLRADASDLAYVAIELSDTNGRLVSSCDQALTVQVEGAGVLAGHCSANPLCASPWEHATAR